jgi:hypothetical protein
MDVADADVTTGNASSIRLRPLRRGGRAGRSRENCCARHDSHGMDFKGCVTVTTSCKRPASRLLRLGQCGLRSARISSSYINHFNCKRSHQTKRIWKAFRDTLAQTTVPNSGRVQDTESSGTCNLRFDSGFGLVFGVILFAFFLLNLWQPTQTSQRVSVRVDELFSQHLQEKPRLTTPGQPSPQRPQ